MNVVNDLGKLKIYFNFPKSLTTFIGTIIQSLNIIKNFMKKFMIIFFKVSTVKERSI